MLIASKDPIVVETAFLKNAYEYSAFFSMLRKNTKEEALKDLLMERYKGINKMQERGIPKKDIEDVLKKAADEQVKYLKIVGVKPEQLY